jgi:hypothetical protein
LPAWSSTRTCGRMDYGIRYAGLCLEEFCPVAAAGRLVPASVTKTGIAWDCRPERDVGGEVQAREYRPCSQGHQDVCGARIEEHVPPGQAAFPTVCADATEEPDSIAVRTTPTTINALDRAVR